MTQALARKQRTEAILKTEGVPFLANLPMVEDETAVNLRTTEEIAFRAMALCVVAVKGEGLEQEEVIRFLDEYSLESALSPKERRFIFDLKPTNHDRAQFSWRYECYWVLLWALSYVDNLGRPDRICDVPRAVDILVQRTTEQFIEEARLRSVSEILDQVDLIYRYDWACMNARQNGENPPADLDAEVVMERHYAFNWLVRYFDQEWDDITTDT